MLRKLIACIHLGLGTLTLSHASTIGVPNSSDIVDQATAIYLVKVSVKNGEVLGEVLKKLKGPKDEKETTVKIASPFSEMSFPFDLWIQENTGKEVIVLGRWLPESGTISLVYGPGSTWPKTGPKTDGKAPTTEECVKFIEKQISGKPQAESK